MIWLAVYGWRWTSQKDLLMASHGRAAVSFHPAVSGVSAAKIHLVISANSTHVTQWWSASKQGNSSWDWQKTASQLTICLKSQSGTVPLSQKTSTDQESIGIHCRWMRRERLNSAWNTNSSFCWTQYGRKTENPKCSNVSNQSIESDVSMTSWTIYVNHTAYVYIYGYIYTRLYIYIYVNIYNYIYLFTAFLINAYWIESQQKAPQSKYEKTARCGCTTWLLKGFDLSGQAAG